MKVPPNRNIVNEKAISLYNKAIDCYNKENFEEAERLYLEALRIFPRFPQALNNLANLYRRIGEFEKARHLYIKSFKIDRNFFLPIANIAYLNMKNEEWKRAYYAFKFAFSLKMDSIDEETIYNMNIDFGICCLKLFKYHEAMEAFGKAVKLKRNSVHAHLGLAITLKELKKYREAFKEIEKVESLGFKSSELNLLKKVVVSKILEN